MAKWTVDIPVTGSMTITVEADTAEAAQKLISEGDYEPTADLCVQCSGYATEINKFPVRFSLGLDQIEAPEEIADFTKED